MATIQGYTTNDEGSDNGKTVRHLSNQLGKTFERRARMDRMNAIDKGDENLLGERNTFNKRALELPSSEKITPVTLELEGTQNNNNNCCQLELETVEDCCNISYHNSMTDNNDIGTVVKHKPPKYPSLPVVSSSLASSLSLSPSSSIPTPVKLKSQSSLENSDDPFSADFENAIGDTIVEDAELEWDHSPDTDINGDLSNTYSIDNTMEDNSYNNYMLGDNVEDLPLPPPPPDLMTNEEFGNGDDDNNEAPLPPPPPLDFDPPDETKIDHQDMFMNMGVSSSSNTQNHPQVIVTKDNLGNSLEHNNSKNNHALLNSSSEVLTASSKVKETAIDGDLDIVDSDITLVGNSAHEITKQTSVADANTNPSLSDPLDSFQSVLVTETPVLNGGVVSINGTGDTNGIVHSNNMDEKPVQPLDVNVITLTDSSTFNVNNSINSREQSEPLSLNTIVRPKSYAGRSRRPYYENVDLNYENAPSLEGRRSRSAYYENTVISPGGNVLLDGGNVMLDQKPPPPPQTLQLKIRPRHHYEEITIEPESSISFTKSIPDSCTIPKSPILSPKKQSPSGSNSAKRVLFQLPNGHHNSDGEENSPNTSTGVSSSTNKLLSVNDRHSFHGLMHSRSSDAVLRSPPAAVKLSNSHDASITFDATKSPILTDKIYSNNTNTINRKEYHRHSTPPVLSPRQSSLIKKSTLKTTTSESTVINSPNTKSVKSGLLVKEQNDSLLQGQSTASSSCSSTSSHHKKGDHVHGSAESDDSYFSDSDFDDDYDDVYNIDDDGMSSTSDFTSYSDEVAPRSPRRGSSELDSAYDVVVELLKTEKAYVDRLHFLCRVVLLNVKVLNNVQEMHVVPPEALSRIFSNVEKIFSLHSSTVLPLIIERVDSWKFCPRLDDVMKDLLPHFGLYHEFVENFNTAMAAMSLWMERCPIFQKLILEVEKTPECRRLKVKQHFLEIVQRVPTYYDLLRNYSSHISEDSQERESVKDVLEAMSELVCELERELGKTDRIKKLKNVQQRLDSSVNIVSPLRLLVKEGKIKSISSKTGKKLDRYLFLMDDMLLICTSQGLGGKHKLKFTLGVDRMQIHDSDNLVIPFTFYVQSKTRAIEFHCGSQEDKQCWVSTLQTVIDEYTKKKLLSQPVTVIQKSIPEEEIGKIAPKMEHPQGQSVCYICKAVMKKINNCKGCGQVVCHKCSSHKIKLNYDNKKLNKVCDECFVLVSNRDLIQSTATFDIPCVKPSDPCIIAGYLQLSFNKGHSWHKRWLTLHDTSVLYSFKNFKEPTVLGSLPLKRFSTCPTSKGDDVNKPTTFKVFNARRTYYLQADNADAMARWIDSLADLCDSKA